MAIKKITISSIFGGWQPSYHFGEQTQYLGSVAIDPDVPLTDNSSDTKTSGVIRPVAYGKFSSTGLDSTPIALINNPKNELTYSVQKNGKIVSYTSGITGEAAVGTCAGDNASGAAYYNNYIYVFGTGASKNDVSRYGPLNGSPSLSDGVWTGSTLGTQTALTNTTYPTTRHSVQYLNHHAKVHVDNKLYFADFVDGRGLIHAIVTKKVTAEGDTNNGTTYNILDLPFGWYPYFIESFGNGLAIAATQTTSTSITQGRSAIFFWDTISPSFERIVPIPDPLCTALSYQNGVLYGLSGSTSGGVRLFRYLGGDSIQTITYLGEGHPPMQGAVDAIGNRIIWGGFVTNPANSAGLFAYGSKSDLFPRGLHNIAKSSLTATSSNGLISVVKNVQQGSAFPKFIMGGTDGTNYNLDKNGTTYQTSIFRSENFNVGTTFRVKEISLRLGSAVASNMTITPKLYFDNEATSATGTVINTTNYPNANKYIDLNSANFGNAVEGKNNFYLELTFSGTALATVLLPIEITLEINE
jgi:hypothetical protein